MSDLSKLLRIAHQEQSRNMHVALPGVIVSYDSKSQSASVKPSLNRRVNGEDEVTPVINDVPVIFPRSGGAFMTFPVRAGDGCLLIFVERSLDEWKGGSGEIAPDDPRSFDLSDAVAIMGLVDSKSGGGSDDVVIKYGSSTVTIGSGSVKVESPSVTVDAASSTFNGNVAINGNLGVTGDMNSQGPLNITGPSVSHNGKNIGATHTHSGVQTGGGNTGAPN